MVARPLAYACALMALLLCVACGAAVASPSAGSAAATTVPSVRPAASPATPASPASPAAAASTATRVATPALAGTPVSAIARRGDVSLELRVDKISFVAGEGGPGVVIARNVGPAPALLLGGCRWASIRVLDEQGQPAPGPDWSTFGISCPLALRELPPGAEERATVWFQVPHDAAGRRYTLQAQTDLGVPPTPANTTITSQPFLTPPLPLTIDVPTAERFLRVNLEADRAGWRFIATDTAGHVPPTPHWMVLEAGAPHTSMINWLDDAPDGCWAGGWGEAFRDHPDLPIVVRVTLAAPGYVVATATQTAPPGAGSRLRPLGTPAARCVPPPVAPTVPPRSTAAP